MNMNKVILEKLAMLMGSRKAWIAVVAIAAVAVLVWYGRVNTQEMLDFYKWVVTSWLASIALESAVAPTAKLNPPTPATPTEGKEGGQ